MILRCAILFREYDGIKSPGGGLPLEDRRLLPANSDWRYKKRCENRVPLYTAGSEQRVECTPDVTTFEPGKRSETAQRSQSKEQRCIEVRVLLVK